MKTEKPTKEKRKPIQINLKESEALLFQERLKTIGLGTAGDLAQMIIKCPEAIEALRPYVKEQMKYVEKMINNTRRTTEYRLSAMKKFAPEKFEELMKETISKSIEKKKEE